MWVDAKLTLPSFRSAGIYMPEQSFHVASNFNKVSNSSDKRYTENSLIFPLFYLLVLL